MYTCAHTHTLTHSFPVCCADYTRACTHTHMHTHMQRSSVLHTTQHKHVRAYTHVAFLYCAVTHAQLSCMLHRPLTKVGLHAGRVCAWQVPVRHAAVVPGVQAAHTRDFYHEHGGPQHMARAVRRDLWGAHVHTYTCSNTCMYTCIRTHAHIHVCTGENIHMHTYMYVHVHTYTCTHTCMYR